MLKLFFIKNALRLLWESSIFVFKVIKPHKHQPMKKFFIYTIMCFLYITLTATTCDDIVASLAFMV